MWTQANVIKPKFTNTSNKYYIQWRPMEDNFNIVGQWNCTLIMIIIIKQQKVYFQRTGGRGQLDWQKMKAGHRCCCLIVQPDTFASHPTHALD